MRAYVVIVPDTDDWLEGYEYRWDPHEHLDGGTTIAYGLPDEAGNLNVHERIDVNPRGSADIDYDLAHFEDVKFWLTEAIRNHLREEGYIT
jgi:hypothetical protein